VLADCRDGRARGPSISSAHITVSGKHGGALAFRAVEAHLDLRYGSRDGAACVDFSWEGSDDDTPASGGSWAALGTQGRLVGHTFIHTGDDSGFVAKREQLIIPMFTKQFLRSSMHAGQIAAGASRCDLGEGCEALDCNAGPGAPYSCERGR
jgi:hypothetical protein